MADDPNRDILPVREGSCIDTCRSNIDPRERHVVCKLDRYQLEDKYLRLLEEANNLKKLSNCQEDKIKRLATKLMRVSANPRACISLDVCDDKNRVSALELENSKLKNKMTVLRNQLLNHTMIGVSSAKNRRPQPRPSSGLITCRSENSRMKVPSCQCIVQTRSDDNDTQNYLVKIEELETEKKEMSSRIAHLEKELATSMTSNQKEKVIENMEYIRVWRQMRQLNDKLIAAQEANESLNVQINDLKRILEDTTKNNREITVALMAEKKRIIDIDEQMLKAKDSQLTLREKDEQIRDLMNEMKILQQHNNELITLSSKYGQVELENMELKKKVSEQLSDQQSLKTAFNVEQTNIVALQAANEQLLVKLQELQRNIDTLTVQLVTVQNQKKVNDIGEVQMSIKNTNGNQQDFADKIERCRKCCETFEKILQLEKAVNTGREGWKTINKSVQTECLPCSIPTATKKEETSMVPTKTSIIDRAVAKDQKKPIEHEFFDQEITGNSLSREKMLKLLDQAQISTPLEIIRIAQKDANGILNYEGTRDSTSKHRSTKVPDARIQERSASGWTNSYEESQSKNDGEQDVPLRTCTADPNKLLLILFEILREYSLISTPCASQQERSTSYRNNIEKVPSVFRQTQDENLDSNSSINVIDTDKKNNPDIKDSLKQFKFSDTRVDKLQPRFATDNLNSRDKCQKIVTKDNIDKDCNTKRTYSNLHYKQQHLYRSQTKNKEDNTDTIKSKDTRFTETSECNCTDSVRCSANYECGYQCCIGHPNQSLVVFSPAAYKERRLKEQLDTSSVKQSAAEEVDKTNFDSLSASRTLEEIRGPYKSWRKDFVDEKVPGKDENLQNYTEELEKCRNLLDTKFGLNENSIKNILNQTNVKGSEYCKSHSCNVSDQPQNHEQPVIELEKRLSSCSRPNECVKISPDEYKSAPLLIAHNQGLVEIHILCLQLSTSAGQILLRKEDISNVSLFISWNIWGQETVRTPAMKCSELNFNSSFVYRISELFMFFNSVLSEYIIFQVNVLEKNGKVYAAARAKLCIKDVLDYPQNKLHYITPVNSAIPCTLGMIFGQLSLWVRLSCDVKQVENFKRQCGISTHAEQLHVKRLRNQSVYSNLKNDDPWQTPTPESFENDDTYGLHDIKAASASNSLAMIENTTSDLGKIGLHSEVSNRNEKNARLSPIFETVDNKEESSDDEVVKVDVNNRSPKKLSSDVEIKRKNNDAAAETQSMLEFNSLLVHPLEKDTIIIQIVDVTLFHNSIVMHDDEVQLLYVEYSFLGHRGADMETVSVKKPETFDAKLVYNFRKKFYIDDERHSLERSTLRAMLDESINPNIKFLLVSEPIPEETDIKECVEIGHAYFNIRDYALGDGYKSISLPIMSKSQADQIGTLKIFILGLDAIRQCLVDDM